jgi:hypothetical protein
MRKRVRATELLRQTRRLKQRIESFGRSARAVWDRLDSRVPEEEIEVMRSTEANILGTLENLLNQGLGDLVSQLNELDELLSDTGGSPDDAPAGSKRVTLEGRYDQQQAG